MKIRFDKFLSTFLKDHFFGLILNIQVLQYDDKVLRQFCSPTFDLNNLTKSSEYKSAFNFAPFGKTKGSDRIFSKENCRGC